jgi:hypothetical protein
MKREAAILVGLTHETVPAMKVGLDAGMASLQDDLQSLRTFMPELEADAYERGSGAYYVAGSYFRLGEKDKGFEWLDRSYSNREDIGGHLLADPDLDGIRNDPRYLDLVKRLGLG